MEGRNIMMDGRKEKDGGWKEKCTEGNKNNGRKQKKNWSEARKKIDGSMKKKIEGSMKKN